MTPVLNAYYKISLLFSISANQEITFVPEGSVYVNFFLTKHIGHTSIREPITARFYWLPLAHIAATVCSRERHYHQSQH